MWNDHKIGCLKQLWLVLNILESLDHLLVTDNVFFMGQQYNCGMLIILIESIWTKLATKHLQSKTHNVAVLVDLALTRLQLAH